MNTQKTSSQNRKRLSALLTIIVTAALLAVFILYARSRHDQPNEPPSRLQSLRNARIPRLISAF